MNDPELPRRVKAELQLRLEKLQRVYRQVFQLASSGTRSEIIEYLSREFNATPIERGDDVKVGSILIRFDRNGRFLDMRSELSESRSQHRIVSREPPTRNADDSGE